MPFPLGISDSQKKTPPLPPTVLSQSDSGSGRPFDDGASFLTFQDTPYTGKLPIIDYTVTAVSTDGLSTVSQTVNSVNPFVLTGLKSGKNYKFKVRARNLVFNSADSSEFGPGLATTVPGRTTSAGATNLANGGGATLSWTAPPNAGKAITSYLITPNIGTPIETGNSSTSYTFSGLTVGTAYNFTVAARNENGLGQASTVSNTITITVPVPVPVPVPTPIAPTPTPTAPTPTPTAPTPTPPVVTCPPTIFTPLFSGSSTCVTCFYVGNGVDCSISAYTCDGGSTGPCTTTPTPTPTAPTPTPTAPTPTPTAPTPTPTAPTPTPTATRTPLYTYNEYRAVCCGSATITVYSDGSETSRCNTSCTPTPTPTAPTPTPTAPTPTPTAPTPTPSPTGGPSSRAQCLAIGGIWRSAGCIL